MKDTFHRFAELPWELRDQIWNLAVRPAHAGTHIFKLYDQETDHLVKGTINVGLAEPRRDVCLRLAAPDCYDSSLTNVCNNNNFSTYLVDGGLWTACKESRLVLKRNFRCLFGSQKTLKNTPEQKQEGTAATGYFEGRGEKPYYFTVLPHQDLFLLEPQNLGTINWCWINQDIPIGSTHWGFRGLKNIALEYNPEWGHQVSKIVPNYIGDLGIVKMIIMISKEAWNVDTFWFVDYNLTRADDEAIEEGDVLRGGLQDVFYSRDRRFVDVGLGWRTRQHWKHIDEEKVYEDDCDKSSTTFLDNIRQEVAYYWEFGMMQPENAYRLTLRVLGWDRRQV